MDNENTVNSTQQQAVAAWVEQLKFIRASELIKHIAEQDLNLEKALIEIQKLKLFISTPKHILGSPISKHGEIAEQVHVRFSNAERLVDGLESSHDIDSVDRLAMEDYLHFGKMVQSKYYNSISGTFNAIRNHLRTYPEFLINDGSYDIPGDQYEKIVDILHRGETNRSSLHKTEWVSEESLYIRIREWEKENNVKFIEVVHPGKADYNEVQLYSVPKTIESEEDAIRKKDVSKRAEIQNEYKPTIQEGIKITAVSAAAEAVNSFLIKVYKKKKEGKRLSEFSVEDWKELGVESSIGATKGAIRGCALYVLTNNTTIPASISNAMITATFGVVAQAYKLEKGEISVEEFIDNSEIMCLDVSMSAISSLIGSVMIPVPILGAIIGNVVGMFMLNISKTYLNNKERMAVENYYNSIEQRTEDLQQDYLTLKAKIDAEIEQYDSLIALAFDDDSDKRIEISYLLAKYEGIPEEESLKNKSVGDSFFYCDD